MKRLMIAMFCGITLLTSGCLPVLIGGAFYQDAKKRQTRESFMTEFRKINLEREKNGLEPLDLCTEKYHFDRGWAQKDPGCRERIKRYEQGDQSALRTPQTVEAGSVPD